MSTTSRFLVLALLALAGCGDPNADPSGPVVACADGECPEGWVFGETIPITAYWALCDYHRDPRSPIPVSRWFCDMGEVDIDYSCGGVDCTIETTAEGANITAVEEGALTLTIDLTLRSTGERRQVQLPFLIAVPDELFVDCRIETEDVDIVPCGSVSHGYAARISVHPHSGMTSLGSTFEARSASRGVVDGETGYLAGYDYSFRLDEQTGPVAVTLRGATWTREIQLLSAP